MLFLCSLSFTSQDGHTRCMVDNLSSDFDVVIINYRGQGTDSKGNKQFLKTPRIYSPTAIDDFLEPAKHVQLKYC